VISESSKITKLGGQIKRQQDGRGMSQAW